MYIPAEISGKDVEQLVPVNQRVEDCAVRTVDHVALIGGPPRHFTIDWGKENAVIDILCCFILFPVLFSL